MNKFGNYLLITVVLLTISFCSVSNIHVFSRDKSHINSDQNGIPVASLHSGDIILREGRNFISQAFRSFSKRDKRFSHAGVIHIQNGQIYVGHVLAAEGKRSNKIRFEPINSFCDSKENTSFAIYRANLDSSKIDKALLDFYKEGVVFDNDFDLNTDNKMYCTELVYKVLTIANQNKKFLNLSHDNGVDYVACDNLYLNPSVHLIYSHTY